VIEEQRTKKERRREKENGQGGQGGRKSKVSGTEEDGSREVEGKMKVGIKKRKTKTKRRRSRRDRTEKGDVEKREGARWHRKRMNGLGPDILP